MVKLYQAAAVVKKDSPLDRQLNEDGLRTTGYFRLCTLAAARTALELGRPTARVRTHLLHITFEYLPEKIEWAHRFSFQSAEVIPIAEAGKKLNRATGSTSEERWEDELALVQAEADRDEGGETFFCVYTFRCGVEGGERWQTVCKSHSHRRMC